MFEAELSGEEVATWMCHVKVRLIASSADTLSDVVGEVPVIRVNCLVTYATNSVISFKDMVSHPLVGHLHLLVVFLVGRRPTPRTHELWVDVGFTAFGARHRASASRFL